MEDTDELERKKCIKTTTKNDFTEWQSKLAVIWEKHEKKSKFENTQQIKMRIKKNFIYIYIQNKN